MASELVHDCPRCGANRITFDVYQAFVISRSYGWQDWFEMFSLCRRCKRATIFVASQKHIEHEEEIRRGGILGFDSLNDCVRVERHVSISDAARQEAPEHVPKDIKRAYEEATTCVSVRCWNAAGAMFRLCIDLATKSLLPPETDDVPNKKTRRDLGLRLPWLFDNGKLSLDLRDLSTCIREDGNDAAHTGLLNQEDAQDLADFTAALLERLHTLPKRLELAEARRAERRKPKSAA